MLTPDLIAKLKEAARRETMADAAEEDPDITAYDCSGGNFDDAYYNGMADGETYSAREILTALGETW